MKRIVNKLRFALLLSFLALSAAAWSQGVPYINKMSITTQMFLEEMAGRLTFDEEAPATRITTPGAKPLPKPRRPIASPDTIDGIAYIASTVRITNESDLDELESKGVIIQCKFDKGLVTTLIPVDKIEDVAAIEGVTRINVSALVRPLTNLARQATNVDDVLTLSADAQNAGLSNIYDGSGVILGVIDDGIDFQHRAFQDKNGNTRIKGAYCYNGNSVTADWTGSGTLPTTDDSSEDHGTHTSTTAGGSSVVVSGSNVTVTDNHANATYGGMAPGADMYLAGTRLSTNYILNAFQKMNNYANQQGKPLVVSNSWGSSWYARDGYSDMSDVLAQYFGDNHPNRICLFASGNEAGMGADGQGGGRYVTGTSSQASPLGTIVRTTAWIESYGYQYYSGMLANAWTRASDAEGIGINIHVINKNNGSLYRSYSYTSTNNNAQTSVTLAGLNLSVFVLFDYVAGQGKHQAVVYTNNSASTSSYVFAIEAYPIGGSSSIVDIYGGDYTYLTNYVSTSGHTWVNGTDDQSMGDEAMDPNVISVGSYVTRNGTNSTGDISDFSSYAAQGTGPTGVQHPWITAPGEVIISGYNHYVSSHEGTVTVNNSTAPYGQMSGTSMATPAAAGIVALWLQAAQEVGKDLTTSEIKNIMAQTAIKDSWVTSGANRSHFGNGKINALGGIQYILDVYGSTDPVIRPNPTELDYVGRPGETYTQQVSVMGLNLTGPITATLSDPDNVFSMTATSASGLRANGQTVTLNAGDIINVSYSPQAVGNHTGTITLTSPGAEAATVTLNGTAALISEVMVCDGNYIAQTLPVIGLYHDENQHNQMIYPASLFQGTTLTAGSKIRSMTFYPTTGSIQQNGQTYYFSGINFYNGSIRFKVANLPSGSSGFNQENPEFKTATLTEVWNQNMPNSANTSATEWLIEFDEEFVYEGGDLLIDVTNPTTGNWGYTYFIVDEIVDILPGYVHYDSNQFTTDYLPKVTFLIEEPYSQEPTLSVDPTEVNIEDETDADRSATVAVTAENLTGALTTTVSNHWSANLNPSNTELTVTYNGKALHQVGSASVHSNADDLHASASADYLYTGPIYVIGDVNNYAWNTNNGAQMSRDENGIYTATVSTQQSSDAAYISFTKHLGSNIDGYRFGPVSSGNWWLTNETQGVYCPLDTLGNVNNIRVTPGYYVITIDSKNNQFMITPAVISSNVSPATGTLNFGTIFTGSTSTQTITITNDGDVPFTPSLNGPSGAFSTDYVPTELAPGESATITITYAPEYSGSDSETFTLSDGAHTYIWTLTGSAVTPVTHGYVDDVNVDFGEKALDETYTYTVRIYNDGDVSFEPTIDASGLDGVFGVTPTSGITVEPGEYYDLTVSFTPTEEGNYNSTFTVIINGVPTTVTVTGSGSATAMSDDIIHSNRVMVPVYKTDIEVLTAYTIEQLENDIDHSLPENVTNTDVNIKVGNDEAITRYDVYHKEGFKESETNWATGEINRTVAYATHNTNSYFPYAKDEENVNDWVQQTPVTFNSQATEMWIHLNDFVTVQDAATWYVPVVVADGVVTTGNTYGAPIRPSHLSLITASVNYDQSTVRTDATNNDAQYMYMTAEVALHCEVPQVEDGVNYHYECYKARAWRIWTPYVIGVGAGELTETLMGEVELSGTQDDAIIGCKDFQLVNGEWSLDEPTFCIPAGTTPLFVSRFYYRRVANSTPTLTTGGGGGGGGGGAGAPGDGPMPPGNPTSVVEFNVDREVVSVTYINPLGMTSSRPFDGVNIIVTRYTDGTTSTIKVFR